MLGAGVVVEDFGVVTDLDGAGVVDLGVEKEREGVLGVDDLGVEKERLPEDLKLVLGRELEKDRLLAAADPASTPTKKMTDTRRATSRLARFPGRMVPLPPA